MRLGILIAGYAVATAANAQLVVTEIGDHWAPTDVSADGSVVVGNLIGPYETFRWTEASGPVLLGRATVPTLGVGGGSPDVSHDGTKVSAEITTDDLLHATQGIWDITLGWQTLMPPTPPDGGLMDNSYGSAWGLSGDGQTLVGMYFRPGAHDGTAHPSAGTVADGVHDLGTPVQSGRANAASYDGLTIGGWTARADGIWQPTVWARGTMTVLGDFDTTSTVEGMNSAGDIVVGRSEEYPWNGATIWRLDGTEWVRDYIGVLPDGIPFYSIGWFSGVSDDGGIAVGATRPYFAPYYQGMIWTPDTGLIRADDWVAAFGATTAFPISQLSAVSVDGRTVVGLATNEEPPGQHRGIIIRCVSDGDVNDDDAVDMQDVAAFQQFVTGAGAGALPPGGAMFDLNCDLDIDGADLAAFAACFGGPVN
jgi:uncharacterized membrane protein